MTQLSMDQALAQRDAALQAVEQHADAAWKARALDAVREVCEQHEFWHCDMIWDTGLDEPAESRALGPVIMAAARRGWCVRTNTTAPSVRSHGSHKPVWASNLYRAAVAA